MISHEHKCIFIHIPKTGGSSIERLLGGKRKKEEIYGWDDSMQIPLQHVSALQLLEKNLVPKSVFKNYFKFAFVRNPFDLVVSEWKWRVEDIQFSYFSKYRWLRMPFKNFIRFHISSKFHNFKNAIGKKINLHLTPQYFYLYDNKGNCLVDFIGRFENFVNDIQRISNILGFDASKIPHLKKTQRNHYATYYDKETVEIIKKLYKIDLQMFNYDFERVSTWKAA